MYKFQSYYYINRTTDEVRQFQSKKEIPLAYRDKIVIINLDVTYNRNGYIDKKSERLISATMVREQQKAPPIVYFKVSYKDEENESDDSSSEEEEEDEWEDVEDEESTEEIEEVAESGSEGVVIAEEQSNDENLSLY